MVDNESRDGDWTAPFSDLGDKTDKLVFLELCSDLGNFRSVGPLEVPRVHPYRDTNFHSHICSVHCSVAILRL